MGKWPGFGSPSTSLTAEGLAARARPVCRTFKLEAHLKSRLLPCCQRGGEAQLPPVARRGQLSAIRHAASAAHRPRDARRWLTPGASGPYPGPRCRW